MPTSPERAQGPLVLGPLLRHVGERTASIWVETAGAAAVTVRCAERSWSAGTFTVEGFHYALVRVDGLEPGSVQEYSVEIDGQQVWPLADAPYPAPVIATLDRDRPTRLAFGSCRTSVPHDAEHHGSHGVDALRTYAMALADGEIERPDTIAFLGDQVYADETSEEMREFIAARRDIDEAPWEELQDYTEYAHLYSLAWSEPANRWVLSTVPTAMIFDDHDIRDDWNTSWTWHEEINQTSWWHERLVGGLTAYWVYQHIGNLDHDALAADPIWRLVDEHIASGATGEIDLTAPLRDLVERNDRHPEVYRWSYTRELGDCRLVVLDSRAARVLEPDQRHMLDPTELEWLAGQLTGDVDHLLVGTSLPFLLPPGLHDFEAVNEAMASGRFGRVVAKGAEQVRQVIDMEHWGAFQSGFAEVFELVMAVARGEKGKPPATITFLSGDVHNSYVAEVTDPAGHGARSRIVQAVCSPVRNPMPRGVRVAMSLFAGSLVRPMRWVAGRSRRIPDPRYPWRVTHGPWFDNNLAVLEVDGPSLRLAWYSGEVVGDDHDRPALRQVSAVTVDGSELGPVAGPGRGPAAAAHGGKPH